MCGSIHTYIYLQHKDHTVSYNVHEVYTVIQTGVKQFGYYRAKSTKIKQNYTKLEMWANAQPDGRPAEYRWRPLFNAAKFG